MSGEHRDNPAAAASPVLGREAVLDLMAYADGELEGDAARRVEERLATDAEAARLVEEFRTLSHCVEVAESARPVPKIVDRIADSVMAQVARMQPDQPNKEPKAIRMRRAVTAGAVCTVLALAAGWFMFFRTDPLDEVGPAAGQEPAATPPASSAPADLPAADPSVLAATDEPIGPGGVELEQVESPTREISVFYVPGMSGEAASSIVVWVGDNKPGTK